MVSFSPPQAAMINAKGIEPRIIFCMNPPPNLAKPNPELGVDRSEPGSSSREIASFGSNVNFNPGSHPRARALNDELDLPLGGSFALISQRHRACS